MNNKKKLVCEVCGKTGDCITLRQFKQHVKSHELKCSYCGDTGDKFTTLRQYKDHLRSHAKCPYCERRTDFSTGRNYQKHLNSHNQNVKCDECETSVTIEKGNTTALLCSSAPPSFLRVCPRKTRQTVQTVCPILKVCAIWQIFRDTHIINF